MNWPSQLWSNFSSCKDSPEKNQGFNGIRTHDLWDTSPMLYQLSCEALWEEVKCEFNLYLSHDEDEIIYTRWAHVHEPQVMSTGDEMTFAIMKQF